MENYKKVLEALNKDPKALALLNKNLKSSADILRLHACLQEADDILEDSQKDLAWTLFYGEIKGPTLTELYGYADDIIKEAEETGNSISEIVLRNIMN